MRHAVITGATGIVGVALTEYLVEKGINVTAIIRPGSERERNIPDCPLVKKVFCDLENIHTLSDNEIPHCDVLFHLAWEGAAFCRDNVEIQLKNVKYLLDAVKLAGALGGRFIGVGSQAEYGRYNEQIKPESPCNPTTAYGIAKDTAQKMGSIYAKSMDIPFIWTRIFSVFGEHDLNKTLVMSCIRALNGQEELCLTKCEQLWDFLYAKDAAEAYYRIGVSGREGAIYNICSGEVQPLGKYVRKIEDVFGNIKDVTGKLDIGKSDYAENQVMFLGGDIENLIKDTGFTPKYSFENGVERTIKWFLKEQKNEN